MGSNPTDAINFIIMCLIILLIESGFKTTYMYKVAWPSGLRRWFQVPVSNEAWVRIPPLPLNLILIYPYVPYLLIESVF